MSPNRSFSVEEYTPTPIKTTPEPPNVVNQTLDQVTNAPEEGFGSTNPIHFRRVQRRIRRARYGYVTSDR